MKKNWISQIYFQHCVFANVKLPWIQLTLALTGGHLFFPKILCAEQCSNRRWHRWERESGIFILTVACALSNMIFQIFQCFSTLPLAQLKWSDRLKVDNKTSDGKVRVNCQGCKVCLKHIRIFDRIYWYIYTQYILWIDVTKTCCCYTAVMRYLIVRCLRCYFFLE